MLVWSLGSCLQSNCHEGQGYLVTGLEVSGKQSSRFVLTKRTNLFSIFFLQCTPASFMGYQHLQHKGHARFLAPKIPQLKGKRQSICQGLLFKALLYLSFLLELLLFQIQSKHVILRKGSGSRRVLVVTQAYMQFSHGDEAPGR